MWQNNWAHNFPPFKKIQRSICSRWLPNKWRLRAQKLSSGYKSPLLQLLSRFSRARLCATPQMAAHQAPPSLGFSRQEHWSGLPFPSPVHESEKWKWSRSVVSDPQRSHGLQPSRLLRPWDFPGKSTMTWQYLLLSTNHKANEQKLTSQHSDTPTVYFLQKLPNLLTASSQLHVTPQEYMWCPQCKWKRPTL